jgi:hypothetical protein
VDEGEPEGRGTRADQRDEGELGTRADQEGTRADRKDEGGPEGRGRTWDKSA